MGEQSEVIWTSNDEGERSTLCDIFGISMEEMPHFLWCEVADGVERDIEACVHLNYELQKNRISAWFVFGRL